MRKRTRMAASLAAACTMVSTVALAAGATLPAQAAPRDYAPTASDVVGVGSDTLQYMLDFGADGDPVGDPGYNAGGNKFKLINVDATADANARMAWANGSTLLLPVSLSPTVVLRAGTYPVQRPNGSGAGFSAMVASATTATAPAINFARMSSNPSATQLASLPGGFQIFVAGTEHLRMASSTTTNSPTALTAAQLVAIYTCATTAQTWNQVGGTSTDRIIPIIPQSGSGTRNTFLADLQAANGGVAITLGGCVSTGEENDPVAITSLTATTSPFATACLAPGSTTVAGPCSNDAVEPFSGARLNLWSGLSGNLANGPNAGTGYFHIPTTAYPGGAALTPGVVQLTGVGSYDNARNLNIVFPWTAQTSTTPWQPGGTLNWAQSLFCNPTGTVVPFFQTSTGKALLAEAGADPTTQTCSATPIV